MMKFCDATKCPICHALALDLMAEVYGGTTAPAVATHTITAAPEKRGLGFLAMAGYA